MNPDMLLVVLMFFAVALASNFLPAIIAGYRTSRARTGLSAT